MSRRAVAATAPQQAAETYTGPDTGEQFAALDVLAGIAAKQAAAYRAADYQAADYQAAVGTRPEPALAPASQPWPPRRYADSSDWPVRPQATGPAHPDAEASAGWHPGYADGDQLGALQSEIDAAHQRGNRRG